MEQMELFQEDRDREAFEAEMDKSTPIVQDPFGVLESFAAVEIAVEDAKAELLKGNMDRAGQSLDIALDNVRQWLVNCNQ